jgi:hypothetical protein
MKRGLLVTASKRGTGNPLRGIGLQYLSYDGEAMPHKSDIAAPMCAERLQLSDVVTKAVQETYAAKEAQDRLRSKKDIGPLIGAAACRTAQRAAVSVLNPHRKEHSC